MEESELQEFQWLIERFHDRFSACFRSRRSRAWARRYVAGLMMEMERRNCWQLAEKLRLSPKELMALQRLLYSKTWDHKAVIEELTPFVDEYMGADDAGLIVDESGVRKWGKRSVGVGRQYLGCVGKIENGQVGVYLTYASETGHAFLDARLYILEEWFEDRERCRVAGIPESVVFRTKPELAAEMVRKAMRRGVRATWLTADEVYGQDTTFLDDVSAAGLWYVVEVPRTTEVWAGTPKIDHPRRQGRGRPRKKPRLSADSPRSEPVEVIAKDLKNGDWQRIKVGDGAKGILVFEFAYRRVVQKRSGSPGPESWLMVRRSLEQDPETKYFLSTAPRDIGHDVLARAGSLRWTVETTIKEGKGQAGLDEYEVRSWNSWHHHMALCILAHAFLAALAVERKKNGSPPRLYPEGTTPGRPGAA